VARQVVDVAVATPPPRGKTGPAKKSKPEPETKPSVRDIPSLDRLLRSVPGTKAAAKFGRLLVKQALQAALTELRLEALRGASVPEDDVILARALGEAARNYYGISEVLNATGVVLHTGLGRAPLPHQAVEAATLAARGYVDLEVDRQTGARGRRTSRAEALLGAITGAESALVVNNGAGALLLTLAALAQGKDVVVSRGELIEIGGEFRLPDIMASSGARLVEVGTTNRTRIADYRKALGRRTGLILKVHPSNFRVVGFTDTVPLADLAELAHGAKLPLGYDIGSGLLDRYPEIPPDEPSVVEALAGGADVVTFSGDKLLGGPQAGLVAGRDASVARLRRHPLARALRVDKMTVAALEAVLRMYATGRREDLPLWRSLQARESNVMARAKALASSFKHATARSSEAVVGGGSLPGYGIPSAELVLPVGRPDRVAARMRLGRPSVFCRIEDASLVFDLRAVPPESDDRLARAIRYALEQE
jgi:L-seryl-tRNA(Ser) seleniumtransferase